MKFFKTTLRVTLISAAMLTVLAACSNLSAPVEPNRSEMSDVARLAWTGQVEQDEPALLAGIDIDGAFDDALITVDVAGKPSVSTKLIDFAESIDDDTDEYVGRRKKWLVKSEIVSATDTTVITFGSNRVGYSTVVFPPGAVDVDTRVTVLAKQRGKRDLFFFPDMDFNAPVTLHYSLEGMNSKALKKWTSLHLFYHNKTAGGWELIDSYSDGEYVHATLEHFSRYAIGSDR